MSDPVVTRPNEPLRDRVLALMPRLAQFDLPERRVREHLWQSDAAMMQRWFDGDAPAVHVFVAALDDEPVAGLAMFSLREELLSHTPSAHLEALAVRDGCEGRGVGSALLERCHEEARRLGAHSMTLHVFARNTRARAVYARAGYDEELLRCIRWFDDAEPRT